MRNEPKPLDLPATQFEVVTPLGTEGPYDLADAHEMRLCVIERGVCRDEDVAIRAR